MRSAWTGHWAVRPGDLERDVNFRQQMSARFADRFRADVPLAPMTTFKVGGPADWFIETKTSDEIVAALHIAHCHGMTVTMLGGGSNVLIGDRGIRGLVIRPKGSQIDQIDHRLVRADAPTTINGLVRWTIHRGLAGLEAWAGTPGTVGGAMYGNAHFGGRLIGDLVESVRLAGRDGSVSERSQAEMEFGYDRSRLQTTGEVLLSVVFRVSPGDPSSLRDVARQSLSYRKKTQPLDIPSAGCIFQNPEHAEMPPDIPVSAGALVDRAGLKGTSRGGARVSASHGELHRERGWGDCGRHTQPHRFVPGRVQERFGVMLQQEIVYMGEF